MRSTWILIGNILGVVYVLGVVGFVSAGLIVIAREPLDVVRTTAILGGTVLIAGWWIVPVVASRADASLDPSRLAIFPVSVRGIQLGQLAGAVVGIPGIASIVLGIAWVASWRASWPALLVAIPCMVVGLITAVAGSRAVTVLSVNVGKHRRSREIGALLIMAIIVLLGPLLSALAQGLFRVWNQLPMWADYVAWTPLGAAWAIPADAVSGDWGTALARATIALAGIVALFTVWHVGLARALGETTVGGHHRTKSLSSAGIFNRVPAAAWSAVMARCLIYWFRDPRYSVALVIALVVAVSLWFTGGGLLWMLWAWPAVVALLMAYSLSADIAADNTAFSLHITAGVTGFHDRLGRALAVVIVAVPFMMLALFITMIRTDGWNFLPAMLGVCVSLLLAGVGLTSVLSARYTYPVAPPGSSPLKSPQGQTLLNVVIQFVTLGAVVVVSLPSGLLALIQVGTSSGMWGWLALLVGIVEGVLLFIVGVIVGGAWLDRRAPELLHEVAGYR